ncbi:hypothetical protein G0Q06_10955 [Puniceicoccales bacterium CK1056]|uniref:FHA domain-containing protein n=1 Tax=Oceanipulchritudo coccoides TaxID=2706888 RepID=A0A6B2M3U3_9BACT|nr:hypothetical protein [Oceanipulchritudo coccoides]NDV62972.1 hypothetical protein [Oceanipulchritudo coccoides]
MKGKCAGNLRLLVYTSCLVLTCGPVWSLSTGRGITRLGGLTEGNYVWSHAEDVSNDGSIVVGYSEIESGRNEAFNYSFGEIHHMGFLNQADQMSRAFGISSDGSVIVGESRGQDYPEATRWARGSMFPDSMGFINDAPTSTWGSVATAVSPDGRLIVGEGESLNYLHAFIKIGDDILRSINPENVGGLRAEDVANNGTVVGSRRLSYYSNIYHAFRWQGNLEDLENLNKPEYYKDLQTDYAVIEGTDSSRAYAVSADGSVVVGQATTPMDVIGEALNWPAFRWENDVMRQLDHLDDRYRQSVAYDVSGDGNIVVGFSTISLWPNSTDREATVWIGGDEGVYPALSLNEWADNYNIDREGFRMEEARAISQSGRFIVGYGRNEKGQQEAFRLVFSEHGSWSGWPVEDDETTVETGPFLQDVNISQSPWVFVHRIHGWVHVLPEHISRNGAWVYMPLSSVEQLGELASDGSPWKYSRKLKTWLHRLSTESAKDGDWTYIPF